PAFSFISEGRAMADTRRTSKSADETGVERHRRATEAKHEATEPEGVRRLERPQRPPEDQDEFVTDAEMEAREIDMPSEEDEWLDRRFATTANEQEWTEPLRGSTLPHTMLTALAVIVRIVANPAANVFQKQLTQRAAHPLVVIGATHGLLTLSTLPFL